MSAPHLAPIRMWARDCAADEFTSEGWREAYADLAAACERLMRMQERSAIRMDGEPT